MLLFVTAKVQEVERAHLTMVGVDHVDVDVGLEDEVDVELHGVLLQLVVGEVEVGEVQLEMVEVGEEDVLVVLVDVEVVLGDDAVVLEADDDVELLVVVLVEEQLGEDELVLLVVLLVDDELVDERSRGRGASTAAGRAG